MINGLPIECDDREDTFGQGEGDIIFFGAVFTKDFGPFRKGEVVEELVLNVFQPCLYSLKDSNKIVKEVSLKFAPKVS